MRRLALLALPACALACGTPRADTDSDAGTADAGAKPVEVAYCAGTTQIAYDPTSKDITIFPDDFWTTDDDSTLTKKHVNLQPAINVNVPPTVTTFASVYNEVAYLDGFGTTAALTVRIAGELDPASLPANGDGSGKAGASVVLVKLGATPEFLDFETTLVPESAINPTHTLVIAPMKPLLPKTEYALVVTQKVMDAAGGCVAPSQTMKDLLDGKATDPGLVRIQPRLASVVEALVKAGALRAKGDVSAAVVFTTEHTTDDSEAIAKDLRARTFAYQAGVCTATNGMRKCEGKFTAGNYRDATDHIADGTTTPAKTYVIPMSTWLPATGAATRTVMFAHGLGASRAQAGGLAPTLTKSGWAVVAIDAPKHGQHPDKAGQLGTIEFFGASINFTTFALALDSRAFRDNLRQAAYDKLQLLQLLKAGIDVDGDGTNDVNADAFAYMGLSLGSIMGPEFLAYAPETKAAVLMVPGARLTDVLLYSSQFQASVNQFRGAATDGDIARVFPMMQAAIERGDPATSALHVLSNRLDGFASATPQVLQQMVINDDVVPNPANRFFARAMGLPLLGDELQAIGEVPRVAVLPAKDTLGAGLSAGVFEFDVVEGGQPATHNDIAGSTVSWTQATPFLDSALTGSGEINDPYRVLQMKQ